MLENKIILFSFLGIIFVICYVFTGILRYYAISMHLLDIPNRRSSHANPTPRGGGLAFVITFLIAGIMLFYLQKITWLSFATTALPAAFIALLGSIDDHYNLSPQYRIIGHIFASVAALYFLGGMPSIQFFIWFIPIGMVLNIFATLYLIWLLNLYNFMDGIDGLAAVEAITVSGSGALLYWVQGELSAIVLPLVLCVTVAGFLWWNFPPARIFMGDAGSGFLGLLLGIFSIQAAKIDPDLFISWLILLGVFIVDATVTLLCRFYYRQPIAQAHCSHTYQHLAKYLKKHLPVTLGVLLINLFWLLPLAMIVGLKMLNSMLGLILAYTPLVIVALRFKAGKI